MIGSFTRLSCTFFSRQRLPSCLPHHLIPSNNPSQHPLQTQNRNRNRRNKLPKLCTSKTSTKGSKSQVRSRHDAISRVHSLPNHPTVLKSSLRGLFKSYGEVLDVVAHKNLRMRGQAFVSFASIDVAKKAAKEVRGFPLYSKPMVRYSRNFSPLIDQSLHPSKYRSRGLGQMLS